MLSSQFSVLMDMHLSDSSTSAPSHATLSGPGGVCLMRNAWKGEHPSVINFISSFLSANSFRLNFVPIAPVIDRFCVLLMFISNTCSLLNFEKLICRTSFSIVGVCL
ncbi:hypothetical protein S245_061535 [Arachis hypogaea]